MNDNIGLFWAALGALTFAELVQVAETLRDSCDALDDFDQSDARDWSFLLNGAREIAQADEGE